MVEVVSASLGRSGKTLSTAESCTGGMLGKLLTDIAGSSAYYWGGVISYDNRAKETLLGVSTATLTSHGAVSAPTVVEMADGIRRLLNTDFALALSGVSGPGGGTPEKPVGTIHVALSSAAGTKTLHQVILNGRGSRDQNRVIAIHLALDLLRDALRN
ncbi:MAG: nicotinamide-nucleotide amidohydrolase family protein [Proteobacteria bacterium]|nr:MAG: nicotinamide-nucleotide amidohydrolase family protein [Pseudomonadota bacterium]